MNTFQIYSDLLLDIDILTEQIELSRREQKQWWIGGRLNNTVPLDNAAARTDKLSDKIEQMEKELQVKTERANHLKIQLNKYQGLEYKVFYNRYIEGKTLVQISDELGYSYQYIKEVATRVRIKEPTVNIQTS
ncbi:MULTISPECIES: hypothetical protein [Bacillus]|uniref:hypothetical protein n=1 Tax=Bacillus TaxID=1386 RepID=UPI0002FF7FF4|nr:MULTISPECIES: hypothetical protein [Bacillus]